MKDYERKTKKLSRKVYKEGKRIADELIRRNRFRDAASFLHATHTFVSQLQLAALAKEATPPK
jgi:hypothetical protein